MGVRMAAEGLAYDSKLVVSSFVLTIDLTPSPYLTYAFRKKATSGQRSRHAVKFPASSMVAVTAHVDTLEQKWDALFLLCIAAITQPWLRLRKISPLDRNDILYCV